jgi:hypothetical protein
MRGNLAYCLNKNESILRSLRSNQDTRVEDVLAALDRREAQPDMKGEKESVVGLASDITRQTVGVQGNVGSRSAGECGERDGVQR